MTQASSLSVVDRYAEKQTASRLAQTHLLTDRVAARYLYAKVKAGESFETRGLRVHRFMHSIRVTDLTFAGKRGKKVQQFALYDLDMGVTDESEEMLEDWADSLRRETNIKKALRGAEDIAALSGAKIESSSLRGVDVAPAGFKPVKVMGKGVLVEADYDSFRVKNLDDRNNEPTCIPHFKGGKKDIKVFYRWVSDNLSKIKSMSFSDVTTEMRKEKIQYHYYCAMD